MRQRGSQSSAVIAVVFRAVLASCLDCPCDRIPATPANAMPLADTCLPISTDWDSIEDSPGSVDPLGTLGGAETLADILLPGMTARMYRVRLLTTSAVTAAIADRVVRTTNGREELRLPARLAFERLLVSALVRLNRRQNDPAIVRRLPGRHRAALACNAKEPLTPTNFLKGQAVNGPFGVMARLSTAVGILDDKRLLGRNAGDLLTAWAEGEGLHGVLDPEGDSSRPGAKWASDIARAVSDLLLENRWPKDGARIWDTIGSPLRPNGTTASEKRLITKLLDSDTVRRRMFDLLKNRESVDAYRAVMHGGVRGDVERHVLLTGITPQLTRSPEDQVIAITARAIEAYESVSIALQQAFDSLRWALTKADGKARAEKLLTAVHTQRALDRALLSLRKAKPRLDKASGEFSRESALNRPEIIDPLESLRNDTTPAIASRTALVEVILERHERVQKGKRKAPWIDRGASWILMPGFGFGQDGAPSFDPSYLHPFRIQNAYSFLSDLGKASVATGDADAD